MMPMLLKKRFRTLFCVGMLVFAVTLRMAMAPQSALALFKGLRAIMTSQTLANSVLYLEFGTSLPEPTAAKPTLETQEQPQTQPAEILQAVSAVSGLAFSAEEAEAISFRGNCDYSVDKHALLTRELHWTADLNEPTVLIVHTHTCEAYTPSEGLSYENIGNYRTTDESRNVIAVGTALQAALESHGIAAVHDTDFHDLVTYNGAYDVSRASIAQYLEQYPSIVLVLDIHRDALTNDDGELLRESVTLDGSSCAKLMLVAGTDEGGLYHPYWQENLSLALKLQALLNGSAPGLLKDLALRTARYNQDMTLGSLLIEVGSAGNTLPEALASVPYLAQALAEIITAQSPT